MPIVSGGGGSFNGGTITRALDVAPGSDVVAFTIAMPAGSFSTPVIWDGPPGSPQELQWTSDGTLRVLDPNSADCIDVRGSAGNNLFNGKDHTGADMFTVTEAGGLIVPAIPTADPHVAGQLYSLAGTLHVSAG